MSAKSALIGFLGAIYIRLLRLSWRLDEQPLRYVRERRGREPHGCVYVMWHSRLLMGAATHVGHDLRAMISRNKDGELIARAVKRLGLVPLRGSSSRGGSEVLTEAVVELQAGHDVAITPDGPRGPRMSVQPGCVLAALRAGVPIVPVAFEAVRARRLRSWDRFVVPGFFTKVIARFGEPIRMPAELGEEGVRAQCDVVREALLEVTRKAALIAGTEPETPDVDPLDLAPFAPGSPAGDGT